MKKVTLILISFLSCSRLIGQQYTSFIDTNSTWRDIIELSCSHGPSYLNHYWYDAQEFLSGDTVINFIDYKKLYLTGAKEHYEYNHGNETRDTSYYCNYYIGGLREDSLKQVFWVDTNGVEHLRFNFNLQIGDSFDICYGLGCYVTVQSIDSVQVLNTYRKRFNFPNGFGWVYLIEGIGMNFGLLGRMDGSVCGGGLLRSYFYSDSLAYPNQTNISLLECNTVGINEIFKPGFEILIYPNPFTVNALISFSRAVYNATFSVYNLLGEKVMETTNVNGESFEFNRGSLQSGVYVFEVSEKGNPIIRGKAVVN